MKEENILIPITDNLFPSYAFYIILGTQLNNVSSFKAMEAVLRQMNAGLLRSRPAQTLLFMLSSLVVLRQQQKHIYSGFWFIKPNPMTLDYSKWPLLRRLKQAFLELGTYFGMGLTIDLFSAFMRLNLKKLRFKTTSFIVTYMGLYKVSKRNAKRFIMLKFNLISDSASSFRS